LGGAALTIAGVEVTGLAIALTVRDPAELEGARLLRI
jgi:hypothetical protein